MVGCAQQDMKSGNNSGYMMQTYYDQMNAVEAPSGEKIYRYISPSFSAANYDHAMVQPVITYPEAQSTDQVSQKTLDTLKTKMTAVVENSIKTVLPLATSPGKGVLKFEMAITGVAISNVDLKAHQYIPIALLVQGAKNVAGGRDQQVQLHFETRVTDSVSGEVLAAAYREISGDDLENAKTELQANNLSKGLEMTGRDMAAALKAIFN